MKCIYRTLPFIISCMMIHAEEADQEQFWLKARNGDKIKCADQEMDIVLPDKKEDTETSITYDLYGPRNPSPENEWLDDQETSIRWIVTGLKDFNLQDYQDQKYCEVSVEEADWGRDLTVTCYISHPTEGEVEEYKAEAHCSTPKLEIEEIYLGENPSAKTKLDIGERVGILEEGPRWSKNSAQSLPFLFQTDTLPDVQVKLSLLPDVLTSGKIKASAEGDGANNLLGDLKEADFETSKEKNMLTANKKLGKALKSGTQKWDWIITELHGTKLSQETLRCTTELDKKGFVIFQKAPVSPWVKTKEEADTEKSYASATILNFIMEDMGCEGEMKEASILNKMNQYLFSSHGCIYISASDNPYYQISLPPRYAYYKNNAVGIDIERYHDLLSGEYVNCADQAAALCALCRLVGISSDLVQYGGPLLCKGRKIVGLKKGDGPGQMTTHVAVKNGNGGIFDPTIGPAQGEKENTYLKLTFKDPVEEGFEDEGGIFSAILSLFSVQPEEK